MNKYTVLPLLNSSFEPGKALETVEQFEDKDFRNIAMAELYYFTGKAKECCEITELYLENEKMELRLSACMLYCYANLTLGRSVASKRGLQGIQECISKAMKKRDFGGTAGILCTGRICWCGASSSSSRRNSAAVGIQWHSF